MILYNEVVNETDRLRIWQNTSGITQEMLKKAQLAVGSKEVLNELVRNTRLVNPTTLFAIDADKRLRFEYINDAMDILRKNRATVFSYVTDKKQ